MPRGYSTRVVLNRRALDAVTLGEGDGLFALARAVIDRAAGQAPDATPHGVGLVTAGGAVAYANGRQIGTWAQTGTADTPRSVRGTSRGQIVVAGGFRFPAHLQEFGTIHHGPQPFLSPALESEIPKAAPYIRQAVAARLATVR